MEARYNMVAETGTMVVERGRRNKLSWRRMLRVAILYVLSISLGIFFFFPYFYTLMSSFKAPWEMYNWPPTLFPSALRWQNYVTAVTMVPFGLWIYNTILITVLSTSGSILTSSIAAFSFARFRYRFRDLLFFITLGTMMMPAQITLIPRYIMFFLFGQWTKIQFLNTYKPLWIPAWFGGGAFSIFLMRQFIQTIPRDFDEAALIDGASHARIFWMIIMPLCKPAIATLTIISVIAQWNSFIEPMIYLNEAHKFPISVGLQYFRLTAGGMTQEPKEHLLMCASVLTTLPPIVLFFLFQEYFVQGVVMSGIKG